MQRRRARLAILGLASLALGSTAIAAAPVQLRVDSPAASGVEVSNRWIEVRGQAAARELAAHDLVLVLDLSDSSLLPSGWDVDDDGPRGRTDAALLERLAAKPDFPPDVAKRLGEADFEDSVLAAEIAAARALIARLDDSRGGARGAGYRIGIVVFSDRARVVAPLGSSRVALEAALDGLLESFPRELRGTNFGDAIGTAQLVLQPEAPGQPGGLPSGRDQSVLLLTDGAPTLPPFGDRARQHALYAASAAAAAGIRIFPIELTRAGAGQGVLEEMAKRSGGRTERLERPGDAIARLRRTDLVGLASLTIVNQTTGSAARALRTFPDGSFDAFVALAPGRNRIAIRATTTDGAHTEVERIVLSGGEGPDAAEDHTLLDELRRRTHETEIWADMEQQRRAPKHEIELQVEPTAEPSFTRP